MPAVAQAIGAGLLFGLVAGTFYPLLAALALGQVTLRQVWTTPKSDLIIAAALVGASRPWRRSWRTGDSRRQDMWLSTTFRARAIGT